MTLLAVHISDGVLPPTWLVVGIVVASGLVAMGCYRLADDDVPRIASMTAAFFVASLIHVSLGPTSVHLLLNGLVGVVLSFRAGLAIAVGLTLQSLLIAHGGIYSLGVNTCIATVPALLASLAFRGSRALAGGSLGAWCFPIGVALGSATAIATVALNASLLALALSEKIAAAVFIAHLPVVAVEGIVVGFAVTYLERVAPDYLSGSLRE
ncbi:MAG: CbiM family transporter [Gemmataceae bacterium]